MAEKLEPKCAGLTSHTEAVRYLWALLLAIPLFAAVGDDLTPHVGSIEIYGARKVSTQKILKALAVKPGDLLTSREILEDRVNRVNNILASRVEAACCAGNDMILYVGVEERDASRMEFHPAPSGDLQLAPNVTANYRRFLDEVEDSIRGKNADEDLTNGYSLMADPDCRSIQNGFITAVASDLQNIANVVRQSADPEQRAAAAYLLQYAPRGERTTTIMTDGIQWALQDDDDSVREAALTSLRAVMVGAKMHPEQNIHIEATWLVALMNSVVWSDRFHASQALATLTETPNKDALDLLRARALPSVLEMARWHDYKHALPAFILAGRLAGFDEAKINEAWAKEDREPVLDAAAGIHSKHSKSKTKPASE